MSYKKEEIFDPETSARIAQHCKAILELIADDAEREGLKDTPMRMAKAMQFLTKGYEEDPAEILKSALFHEDYRQMVVVKDIDLHSLCEHHLLPFMGKCHVAYIPDGTITGLSKIARTVEAFARRLQVQERLTRQICDCIQDTLEPKGVAVTIEAEHTCMSMRGVQKTAATTVTSAYSGIFLENDQLKAEYLGAIGKK
ncbi:MAG: GTP cyclohydrolase I FolE [Bacteroidales bacterium]|nr:GTP cyclohydrolase I FolE [Bacteroidales bacterium]